MAITHGRVLCYVFAFVLVAFLLLQYFLNSGKLTANNQFTPSETDPSREAQIVHINDFETIDLYTNVTNEPLKSLRRVPDNLTKLSKCPACFGRDICDEIESGTIQIDVPEAWAWTKYKGVYFGLRHGIERIVVKTLVRDKVFQKFDSFICQNVTGTSECNVADAIARSYIVNENTWTSRHFQESWKIVHPSAQL